MNNKYTLGALIFLILMGALFGVSRAISWLTQSSQKEEQRIAIVEGDRNQRRTRSVGAQSDGRADSESDSLFSEDAGSSANRSSELGTETSFDLSPLEEAGTYIQRQKRVERDPEVLNTRVEVAPNATFDTATNPTTPTPAQPNTRVPNQPEPSTAAPARSPSRPASAAPAAPAVPALW